MRFDFVKNRDTLCCVKEMTVNCINMRPDEYDEECSKLVQLLKGTQMRQGIYDIVSFAVYSKRMVFCSISDITANNKQRIRTWKVWR